MGNESWKDIAELIGITAIVASLIFVGMEMRQTQVIAKATLYQMRSDSGQTISEAFVFSDVLHNLPISTDEELSQAERVTMYGLQQMTFGHFENSHHLYQLELLSDEQWASDRNQIMAIFQSAPRFRDGWRANRAGYRSSFADEVDQLLTEIESKND